MDYRTEQMLDSMEVTLIDHYAAAALAALVPLPGIPDSEAVDRAFKIARLALRRRATLSFEDDR